MATNPTIKGATIRSISTTKDAVVGVGDVEAGIIGAEGAETGLDRHRVIGE
jgi:hypothetical protein